MKQLIITGIRGVPAAHGGFETFSENLAVYLVKHGWKVTVYCQESYDDFQQISETEWQGVRRIHIPVKGQGAKATIIFDYLSLKQAAKEPGLILTLGYNTALFNLRLRLSRKKNLINMDGIEWKRDKWKWYEKAWLYMNERVGALTGNHLIADHPEIKNHLKTRVKESKITMIPYGARDVTVADVTLLEEFKLKAHKYALVIARAEPENSILEIVQSFSSKPRAVKLVVLGKYDRSDQYHAEVLDAASSDVLFVGAVYEHAVLDALRFYSCLYVHGHTVGGTNPSLIEALGAGQPVLAHDNHFNRWVAGEGAAYFLDTEECNLKFDELLHDKERLLQMTNFSRRRFDEDFKWQKILAQYERLFLSWY